MCVTVCVSVHLLACMCMYVHVCEGERSVCAKQSEGVHVRV